MKKFTLNGLQAVVASSILLMSSHAFALGGYLICSTTNPFHTYNWMYAGEASQDFINKYGKTTSKDTQTVTTSENYDGGTYIFTQNPLSDGSATVVGYNPNHDSTAGQTSYLTFSNVSDAKAFCDELVKICIATPGNNGDYYYVAVARGANAEFRATISVNYITSTDATFPNNLASTACPYLTDKSFPNNSGGPRYEGDGAFGHPAIGLR